MKKLFFFFVGDGKEALLLREKERPDLYYSFASESQALPWKSGAATAAAAGGQISGQTDTYCPLRARYRDRDMAATDIRSVILHLRC